MIFKQYQQILDGTKTQTRRPVKPGDRIALNAQRSVDRVYQKNWRLRWGLNKTYAVQPGRGKKSIGRIRITKIRRERIGDISYEDLQAEGIEKRMSWSLPSGLLYSLDMRSDFLVLWNSLYRKPYHWEDNPEVWVLEFELVKIG